MKTQLKPKTTATATITPRQRRALTSLLRWAEVEMPMYGEKRRGLNALARIVENKED